MPIPGQKTKFLVSYNTTFVDSKTQGLLNTCKGLPVEKGTFFGQTLPKVPDDMDEIPLKRQLRYIEKTGENTCKFVGFVEMSLGAEMTKSSIIETVIKGQMLESMKRLQSAFRKVLPTFEERANGSKKEFYDKIRKIFNE